MQDTYRNLKATDPDYGMLGVSVMSHRCFPPLSQTLPVSFRSLLSCYDEELKCYETSGPVSSVFPLFPPGSTLPLTIRRLRTPFYLLIQIELSAAVNPALD